jgi:hypothetical protein
MVRMPYVLEGYLVSRTSIRRQLSSSKGQPNRSMMSHAKEEAMHFSVRGP